MNRSIPGLPVHHQLPEFTQTHVHWVGDAIQPSHPLWSPSPPALNLSQHQDLFKWVSSSHQVAKVLEFQLQHQSFQCHPGVTMSQTELSGWVNWNDIEEAGSLLACVLSYVQICVTLWTVACQTPLSMRFSRPECWSGLPCSSPGNLPDPGIEPTSLIPPAWAGRHWVVKITNLQLIQEKETTIVGYTFHFLSHCTSSRNWNHSQLQGSKAPRKVSIQPVQKTNFTWRLNWFLNNTLM